ncbi:MAG TPA: hypothetical protein VMD56_05765 [Steroidobacteraceae bacterium]|nr:hypothetical protein [Steroidobacteraceae bacterium]
MAIKRPSKSRGTPVRKTVTSSPVRHVDVRSRQQMTAEETYSGWLCKNRACGLVIAIAPVPPGGKLAPPEYEDQLTALKCPHCGDEDLYRWSARAEHKYLPKSTPG